MNKMTKRRGRPPGIRAAQLELQEKLYNHLLMDRMLPISVCDKNADIREKITINVCSVEIPDREEKVVN